MNFIINKGTNIRPKKSKDLGDRRSNRDTADNHDIDWDNWDDETILNEVKCIKNYGISDTHKFTIGKVYPYEYGSEDTYKFSVVDNNGKSIKFQEGSYFHSLFDW